MRSRTFIILIVIAAITGAAAWFMTSSENRTREAGTTLFSDLDANALTEITIGSTDGEVTLKKGDDIWKVAEKASFPADFNALSGFVKKIKELKVGRAFPASNDALIRMSLMPPDKTGGAGTRYVFKDRDERVLADFIIGKERKSNAGSGGQYLKMTGGDSVYLVDGSFPYLQKTPSEWIQKSIIDVNPDMVKEVVCYKGADKQKKLFTLSRPEEDSEFTLFDGRGNKAEKDIDASKITDLTGALSSVDISDVAENTDSGETGWKSAVIEFRLFDDKQFTAYPGPEVTGTENHYLRIIKAPETPEEETPPSETYVNIPEDTLGQYTYIVSQWKYKKFITDIDDFVQKGN